MSRLLTWFVIAVLSAVPWTFAQEDFPRNALEFRKAERELRNHPSWESERLKLARQALSRVADAPETKESEAILHWVLRLDRDTPEAHQAVDWLLKHHRNSSYSIRKLLNYAQKPTSWTPTLFEGFSEEVGDGAYAWVVPVTYALHEKSLLLLADELKNTDAPQAFDAKLGERLRKELTGADIAQLESEVIDRLSTVAAAHGEKDLGGILVKDFCDGAIYFIRHLRLGKHATGLEGETVDGNRISLSDLEGKVVFIDFWATWCAPCYSAFPILKRLDKNLDESEFEIVGVSLDKDDQKLREVVRQQQMTWPVLHARDERLHVRWQALSLPTYYVLDAEHVVRYRGGNETEAFNVVQRLLKVQRLFE